MTRAATYVLTYECGFCEIYTKIYKIGVFHSDNHVMVMVMNITFQMTHSAGNSSKPVFHRINERDKRTSKNTLEIFEIKWGN